MAGIPALTGNPRAAMAQALLMQGAQGGTDIGSGIRAAGSSIVGALLARQAGAERQRQQQALGQLLAQAGPLLTGGSGGAMGGTGTVPGVAAAGGAGFSTGQPGMTREQIVGQLLASPEMLQDPRAQLVLQRLMPQPTQGFTLAPGAQRFDAAGNLIASVPPAPDQTTVNVSPFIDLTKANQTEVQRRVLDTQTAQERMNQIAASFDPSFLQLPTQLGMEASAFRERVLEPFGVFEMSPEDRQQLARYATFQRDVTNNLSLFVQELSGAAVTPQEAERLSASVPVMGDSPTEFKAKMDATIRDSNRALARYNFALRQGLDPLDSGIPLEGIDRVIDDTGDQLRQQLQASGMTDEEQINTMVRDELRRIFGLM